MSVISEVNKNKRHNLKIKLNGLSAMEENVNCKHFVQRKKRFCKMTVQKGSEYCGEHQPQDREDNPLEESRRARIPCPLDPKHTCFAHKLHQHLKKCNAKPTALPSYIQKNVNCGVTDDLAGEKRLLANIVVPDVLQVIEKVNKVHNDVMQDMIVEKYFSHPILEEVLSSSQYGDSKRKHLIQTSSIISLLENYHLLCSDTCFVEFGAGKGNLSYWVAKTLESINDTTSSVLLVERASHRHKLDNKLDKSTNNVERIRADIADLVLSKVDVVQKSKAIVGLTKHLCGDATDLALHCLISCQNSTKKVSGVIMAFCCHHRCQWSSFVGKQFFEEYGLTQFDFDVMCGCVSWAVCGTGQSREGRQNKESIPNQSERDALIGLSREQKAEIGKKCKNLLNWGRKQYLTQNGYDTFLCYYVHTSVSLENACIVAVKNQKI